tara:strand:- start:62 stop:355 length:294 start_codon:yes stop_codon:yes gene_type:complete
MVNDRRPSKRTRYDEKERIAFGLPPGDQQQIEGFQQTQTQTQTQNQTQSQQAPGSRAPLLNTVYPMKVLRIQPYGCFMSIADFTQQGESIPAKSRNQ